MARSPLFDIFDPRGLLDQQAELGLLPEDEETDYLGIVPLGKRKATISDLMPKDEQRTFLRSLSNAGASGLAGLGWLLDTPGAMVRGALSGGLGKGVSALWETSDDRVTGRELARQYGLAGDQDTWGNFAGGLATEVLLDPTTYASFGLNQILGKGAKTAAGQAAQKAGLLDEFDLFARNTKDMGAREAMRKSTPRELLDNIADPAVRTQKEEVFRRFSDDLDAPLARMNRVGVPWMEQGAVDFYGESIGDAVARGADQLGDWSAKNPVTGPVVRGMAQAFDPDVLGMLDYDRQWEARGISAARRQRSAADRRVLTGLQYDAEQALGDVKKSLNDPDVSRALRNYAETGDVPPEMAELFDLPAMRSLRQYWDSYRNTAVEQAKSLGMPLNEFQSRAGTGYFPRQQMGFDLPQKPQFPQGVTPPERLKRVRRRGAKVIDAGDATGRRREYTDVMGGSETLNRMSLDADLQDRLRRSTPAEARALLEDWASRNNDGAGLYDWVDDFDPESGEFAFSPPPLGKEHPLTKQREALQADIARARAGGQDDLAGGLQADLDNIESQIPGATREAYKDKLNQDLGDLLRSLDPQYARKQKPLFGRNAFSEMADYTLGRGRAETDAQQALELLKKNAEQQAAADTVGGVNYTAKQALDSMGLTGDTAEGVLAGALGVDSLDNISFNRKFVDDWKKVIERGRVPEEVGPLLDTFDDFTKSFKTLALLFPSRYTRDAYSGAFAAASKGAYSWADRSAAGAARVGDYGPLLRRLKDAPGYENLSDAEKVRKYLVAAGEQNLSVSTYADETMSGAAGSQMKGLYPGASKPTGADLRRRVYNPDRTWKEALNDFNPFAVRTESGNRNPLLELGDRAAETTDAWNRGGTYLTLIRKGVNPSEARRISDLTQVNYRPEAFTNFERDWMKRAAPFYSYTRGIMPYIADEVINQPAGLMGQATRAINRASEPSEDAFIPEDMRQSVAIPIPEALGGKPTDTLQRFVTNVDLPFEGTVNLISQGVGNNVVDKVFDAARKTGMNIMGMTHPLFKAPLELLANRQFYTGRELSDSYSMLEGPLAPYGLGSAGRLLEQAAYNTPGGSRVAGVARQIMDDRTSGLDKWGKFAVNTLAGVKFKDVDQERTRRLAARNMLNELLETTPGVKTYENITVPDDVLARMPEAQRQQYLLYRIIQAEAAKRARDRKKAETALDPLQVLGVTNRF